MAPSSHTTFDNFIPEVWSKKFEAKLDHNIVMAKLVNTDFEGEIKNAGDTVQVNTIPDITISSYTRYGTLSNQNLTFTKQTMTIDQQKYFSVTMDDLDKAQTHHKDALDRLAERGGIAMAETIDTRLLSHYADVPAGNTFGASTAPISLNKDNIYSYIVSMMTSLGNAKVPTSKQKYLVVTPTVKGYLLQAPEFLRATGMGDDVVKNGYIGMINGAKVYETTNSPTVSSGKPILLFTREFISFGMQVNKVEKFRPHDAFADGVKALTLYGSKVFTNHANFASLLWAPAA